MTDRTRKLIDRLEREHSLSEAEYAELIINRDAGAAKLLAEKLAGTGSHVNLIRLNHVEESPLKPSTPAHLKAFVEILSESGINVTVRRRLGSDIDASCGQLRRKTAMEDLTEHI